MRHDRLVVRIVAASITLLLVVFSPTVLAQQVAKKGPGPQWQPGWRRVGPLEGAITLTIAAGSLGLSLAVDDPQKGWERNLLIDTPLRNVLRARTKGGRQAARLGSDVLFYAAALYPLVVEAGAIAWVHERNSDVAGQMALISLESLAVTQALVELSKKFVGRTRPLVAGCGRDPQYDPACHSSNRYRSFPSGHAAVAFTGAGLVCVHQQRLHLYGEGRAANVPCYLALGVATMTGLLRIAADRHHATDVLAGALVGVLSGYLLPRLLHYRNTGESTVGAEPVSRQTPPFASPRIIGFGGRF